MAARHNFRNAEGGAAAYARAHERAAATAPEAIHLEAAARLARVSSESIQHAWRRGDLQPLSVQEDGKRATFAPDAVKAWARSRRLIF
jgi:hypothetical protein